ncbi:MAG: hypothetical protein ACRED0_02660 [Gammaproteobacteria bacterium]
MKKRAAVMLGIDPRNMPYLLRKHHLHDGRGQTIPWWRGMRSPASLPAPP